MDKKKLLMKICYFSHFYIHNNEKFQKKLQHFQMLTNYEYTLCTNQKYMIQSLLISHNLHPNKLTTTSNCVSGLYMYNMLHSVHQINYLNIFQSKLWLCVVLNK